MNLKTQQYITALDEQFAITQSVHDEEQQSMLAKYLCVRTAGLVEAYIKTRISDYINKSVPKEVKRYICGKFKDITNLSCKKLRDVLDSFSNEWANDFDVYVAEHEQQKNSLDSIIANRHNIVHGQPGNLSFHNLQQYYTDIKHIIDKLDSIIS